LSNFQNMTRNVIGRLADIRVEHMLVKPSIVGWQENKVYNRVGVLWVICKSSRARV